MNNAKKFVPLLLILLLGFALRTAQLTDLPPGLTHDEANHGREALGILDGIFLFYFPLNYGSEPFYSYTVAGLMGLVGESLFALRLVNVLFGTAVLPLTYVWTQRVFNRQVALLTIGLMALTFWPLASSRQALRAGMLPFFFGLAVLYFWQLLQRRGASGASRPAWTVGFGVCIALTLHIYLASRVAWLIFPLFVMYLYLIDRARFGRVWRPTALGLLLTAILIMPMFFYLRQNPYALTRLDMLDSPLQQLLSGNLAPVLRNVVSALLAFVWPGQGDQFLAYNIPGRPVFDAVSAVFFVFGLLVCVRRWKRPSYAFVLLWFGVGIVPSLLTGATANTTRNLAALAPVHLFPALGFYHAVGLGSRLTAAPRWVGRAAAALWLLFVGWQTGRAYFVTWGNDPAVRGAYQRNLVETLAYLDEKATSDVVLISTVYPGPVHDASISLVLTAQNPRETRWMDARFALLLPPAPFVTVVVPQSTPPHPFFDRLLLPIETVALRPTDLDPDFTVYTLNAPAVEALAGGNAAVNFNDAITLLEARWLSEDVTPGGRADLLTVWRVNDPARIGPVVPPAFTTDVAMFAQLISGDGMVLAQRDALDAPSWNWRPGDTLIQIQPLALPETAVPGQYQTIIGFYDRATGTRTPVLDSSSFQTSDFATAPLLTIQAP